MRYVANPVHVEVRIIVDVGPPARDGSRNLVLHDGEVFVATAPMLSRFTPVEGDYWVKQEDGYVYLNPKDVLERKYRLDVNAEMAEMLMEADVDPLFGSRRLTGAGLANVDICRSVYTAALRLLSRYCPPSREFSIARTNLETSCMFAVKSIANDERYATGTANNAATPIDQIPGIAPSTACGLGGAHAPGQVDLGATEAHGTTEKQDTAEKRKEEAAQKQEVTGVI